MTTIEKLTKLGYKLEEYSRYESDNGKFFVEESPYKTVATFDTKTNTLEPMNGYYCGYLKKLAKKLGVLLIDEDKHSCKKLKYDYRNI